MGTGGYRTLVPTHMRCFAQAWNVRYGVTVQSLGDKAVVPGVHVICRLDIRLTVWQREGAERWFIAKPGLRIIAVDVFILLGPGISTEKAY